MDLPRDLFIILFLGVLALVSGVQIGWGINRLRRREWTMGVLVTVQGLFIPALILLLGDERFYPPSTSIFVLAVVGVIFFGSILAQIWFLPRPAEDLGQETVSALTWGSAFILGGAAFALVATLQNNTVTGICGGIFIGSLGIAWFVPGVRAAVKQAFNTRTRARPSQPRTERAAKNAQDPHRTP